MLRKSRAEIEQVELYRGQRRLAERRLLFRADTFREEEGKG